MFKPTLFTLLALGAALSAGRVALAQNAPLQAPAKVPSRSVVIVGAVSKPGVYALSGGQDLPELLAQGGATLKPDTSITVIRNGALVEVAPGAFELRDGDVVSVSRQLSVLLLRASGQPGATLKIIEGDTLAALLARAGVIVPDGKQAIVLREGKQFPFEAPAKAGATEFVLRDNDVIVIRAAPRAVTVAGAVARPGVYQLGPNDGLTELLAMADGLSPDASAKHVYVLRGGAIIPLSLEALGRMPTSTLRLLLKDGDVLVVPTATEAAAKFYVGGAIKNPGLYALPVESKISLLDAITLAGGATSNPRDTIVRVYKTQKGKVAISYFIRLSNMAALEKRTLEQGEVLYLASDEWKGDFQLLNAK